MASRRNIPPAYDDRYVHPSEMIRHGPLLSAHRPMDPEPSMALLENTLASQKAELERLAGDNHKLSSFQLAMKQDLIAAQKEAERLRDHIRNIQTEGDIEIRGYLEEIAKMEDENRIRRELEKELEEAHLEARRLVEERAELTAKVQQSSLELEKSNAEVEKIAEAQAELDALRKEHSQLRETFRYERAVNNEKVASLYVLESEFVAIHEEVDRLRAEVKNAEKRANAPGTPPPPPPPRTPPPPTPPPPPPPSAPIPYENPYIAPNNFYPAPYYGNGSYVDSLGRPLQMVNGHAPEAMYPYPNGGYAVGPSGINGPPVENVGDIAAVNPAAWGGVYDPNHTQM